jgi:4-alpha-glucanotransferase
MRFPRAAGVLLHLTSLPGPHGSGDLGPGAHHFVDWLATGGQGLWQVLPLGGIGPGNSPYMSMSAFAGNELLIDLAELRDRGWLDASDLEPVPGFSDRSVAFDVVVPYRHERLAKAARRFEQSASAAERAELATFTSTQERWLRDYALFMALTEHFGAIDWCEWDAPLARRDPAALQAAEARHAERVAFWTFCQWCFDRQWQRLRAYANRRGVRIVGDVPIFIAHHSADVWAHPGLFELDAGGRPLVVAGVPPDLFSATGQRWGNPLYRWAAHAQSDYAWWIARIRHTLALVDAARVDHFRGFAAHWEIAADEPTAINGHWVAGPGEDLFRAIEAALGPLPLIAEDLGVITPDVDRLRRQFGFPGMRVLQFAWAQGDGSANRYLPHNHEPDAVAYTGTHDNDTAVGWWSTASDAARHHLREYLATDGHDIAWDLVRAAHASVADTAIVPLQDVLRLGNEHRMNVPAEGRGQWAWRFSWADVRPEHAEHLLRSSRLYGRTEVPSPARSD